MDRGINRRAVLRGTALAAAAMAGGPFQGFTAWAEPQERRGRPIGYGTLGQVADLRDGQVRLSLPEGFQYRSFDVTGGTLGDGTTIPGRHDGMAAFRVRGGRTLLVRNHEVNGPVGASAIPAPPTTRRRAAAPRPSRSTASATSPAARSASTAAR